MGGGTGALPGAGPTGAGPAVAGPTVAELLATAEIVEPFDDQPGKSGATLFRVRRGDERLVLKYLDPARDWTVRAAGVLGAPVWPLWSRGVLARLPGELLDPTVAVTLERTADRPGWRTAVLMRDVGAALIPSTDEPIPAATNTQLLTHMAAMHAAFWSAGPEIDVVPAMHRYLELSPWTALTEADLGSTALIPELIARGWPLLADVAPAAAAVVTPLARDPGPLVAALEETPQTLVHGCWKLDNLGALDGPAGPRTVVLDWETSGRGSALTDLAWYLAINCRRLPVSKEAAIDTYRAALEAAGVPTGPWWDRQLALCLLGGLVQFGWEKALGGYDAELAWWEEHAVAGARVLA